MPLNRPALSLGNGPRGVQDARRWVVTAIREIGRDELVECAEMAVSEVVTNALLHGEQPIQVRVRGTREHPRVEVRDGSTEPPTLPAPASGLGAFGGEAGDDGDLDFDLDALDEALLTFGRGLSIVARASDAWGAEIEADGKIVWFSPAAEFSDDAGSEGQITGEVGDATGEQPVDPVKVRLLDVPVKDYVFFHNHFRELRREVRLLAMAHEADYPLAKDLSDVFHRLGRPLTLDSVREKVDRASRAGHATTDLEVVLGRAEAQGVGRLVELLALTDAFAREEKMLALARTPRQVEFQTWILGELLHQADGDEPHAWVEQSPVEQSRRTSVS
ncbi:ATP-binding protein [Nocardioides sp. C4-1]|uniref:ATP-binding protein n=1 Tax=Nocardioides sp. C4-1 TaxID=3151851 RepID=UPI003264F613